MLYISVANLINGKLFKWERVVPWKITSQFCIPCIPLHVSQSSLPSSDSLAYFQKWFDVSNLFLSGTWGQCLTSLTVICILIFLSNATIKSFSQYNFRDYLVCVGIYLEGGNDLLKTSEWNSTLYLHKTDYGTNKSIDRCIHICLLKMHLIVTKYPLHWNYD